MPFEHMSDKLLSWKIISHITLAMKPLLAILFAFYTHRLLDFGSLPNNNMRRVWMDNVIVNFHMFVVFSKISYLFLTLATKELNFLHLADLRLSAHVNFGPLLLLYSLIFIATFLFYFSSLRSVLWFSREAFPFHKLLINLVNISKKSCKVSRSFNIF